MSHTRSFSILHLSILRWAFYDQLEDVLVWLHQFLHTGRLLTGNGSVVDLASERADERSKRQFSSCLLAGVSAIPGSVCLQHGGFDLLAQLERLLI